VLVAAGHVWVSDRDGFVRRIDPRREAVVGRTRVQRNLYTMVSAPGVVWVTAEDDLDPSVAELDARTGRLLRRIKTDQTVYLAETGGYAAGTLWGALKQGDVARLDPKSGRVVKTVSTDGYSVATDRRHVWVSWPPEGQVQAIDAQTNRAAGPPLKVGAEMEAMAFGFGSVWAADVKNATLTRISA
jgi:DNA-binding beta-propeller fold protein YncE